MDASARVTMKDAAKCDKRRERQISENQENAERILHFRISILEYVYFRRVAYKCFERLWLDSEFSDLVFCPRKALLCVSDETSLC
jgi:hypothetical protein